MTTTEGPSAKDREDAVKAVELACAEGQIIPADRDLRIAQIRSAQSQAEVDLALGSLKSRLRPPTPPDAATIPVSAPDTGPSRRLPFGPVLGGLVSVVIGIAIVVFLVSMLSGVETEEPSGPGATASPEDPDGVEPGEVDVLSAKGYRDLVAAVKEETGTTRVFDATIYPTYAVLQLPVDRETQRQAYHYWDGRELEPRDSFGRSSQPRVDLSIVNVDGMLRLVRQVRNLIEEPTSWYVIVNAPDESDPSVMYAYASNKFTEGGYISATAKGEVVRKVTW